MKRVAPVMKLDASDARNTAAGPSSAGSPQRAKGTLASIWARAAGSFKSGVLISVANGPGQRELTLIPCSAHSSASVLVSRVSPPLLEAYGVRPGREISPSMLDTVRVELYGSQMSLNQVASVSAPEPRTILVTPFDKAQLKVIEKFTRTGDTTMDYRITVIDEKTWTKPWTILIQLERNNDYQLLEYACHEGNYAMKHILSGARAEESGPQPIQ